jgi:hypothetical protein
VPAGCSDCHDAHGGNVEKLIRPFQHKPFADHDCDACHEGGRVAEELRSPAVCQKCHQAINPTGGHSSELAGESTCIDCHSPHAGSDSTLVR